MTTHTLRRVFPMADSQKMKQIGCPGIHSPFGHRQPIPNLHVVVQVWNRLSVSLWWRYSVRKNAVVAKDTLHERFLVWMFVNEKSKKKTVVLVFDPQTPVPSCVRVVNFDRKVWSAGFHPGTGDIVLVDKNTGIWRLDGPHARSLDAVRRKQAHVAAIASLASKNGEQETKSLSAIYTAASGGGGGASQKKASHEGQSKQMRWTTQYNWQWIHG